MAVDEKVLDMIAKLKAHADSAGQIGNQAEAEAFAAKVQELLFKHDLSLADVEGRDATSQNEPITELNIEQQKHRASRRVFWLETLSSAVARSCHCKIMVNTRSNAITFCGTKRDIEIAAYMFTTLVDSARRIRQQEHNRFKREGRDTRGFMTSFTDGFAIAVAERLRTERKYMEDAARAEGKGTALMVLDKKRERVAQWMQQQGVRSVGSAQSRARSQSAYDLGKEHGSKANLRANGLREGGTAPKRLT